MVPVASGFQDVASVEARIRTWLADVVVGLNLCPFARPLLGGDSLRIAICSDAGPTALRRAFLEELDLLQRSAEEEIATTLLAFPDALGDFDEYLEFLDEAQALLDAAGLEGLVQLASFHPDYLFAGEPEDAASHYSNRAPYPLIHLLREDMLTRVLADGSDPGEIPTRNIATLEAIGVDELARRWRDMFGAA
ncbi:MAG: DUF1415 domain-containing protein [Pseudomonadales bacterium]|nr:DUF1415 domain-containing protein [Halioglobus sp.]MCP5128303.1 DUF1415 domain-containing protein [Pseudomonadales bacterium]